MYLRVIILDVNSDLIKNHHQYSAQWSGKEYISIS